MYGLFNLPGTVFGMISNDKYCINIQGKMILMLDFIEKDKADLKISKEVYEKIINLGEKMKMNVYEWNYLKELII